MSKFKGKRVLIVGFGLSGIAAARYFSKQGAKVIVTDLKQPQDLENQMKACADLKLEYELGRHNEETFKTVDLVIMSPGIPLNLKPLDAARAANIPITNEFDLAASLIKEPIIVVTGTNGKTTTTTLIGEMFKADGRSPFVGGNIGKPLIDYVVDGSPQGTKCDIVVSEVSSFQLELADKLVPSVAVFTNMEEDHLDRYGTMDAYIAAKKRLLKVADRNSYVVLNRDCPIVSQFASECNSRMIWFTKRNPMEIGGAFAENFVGCYLKVAEKKIVARFNGKEELYDTTGLKLFGDHNKENLMAAICAARALGVSAKAIQTVINSFAGVPHRLEFIRKKDGVFFFNDSKGTNVMSVRKSLEAFAKNPIILIMGGKDKNAEFAPLQDLVHKRVKMLILLGEAKEKINRSLGDYTETLLVGTFEEAVLLSFQKSRSGDIILLSPGCASYDMFKNFEERGDYFRKLVTQI